MQAMLDKTLAMAPNILAALMIGVVGWIVARILRGLVTNLLAAVGADNLGNKLGHTAAQVAATEAPANGLRLSSLGGTIVYIMVLVPALIAALDALKIEAISRPATDMLQQFLTAVPHIIAAVVIVLLTWYVARFAAMLLRSLLQNVGADALPAKLGMQRMFSGSLLPSNLAGSLLMFFAMLFAVVEAANQLGFTQVSDLLTTFTAFGGDILLGSVIMIIGFWLANLADRMWLALLGIVAVLIPLSRVLPPLYEFRIRRRVFRWYARLRQIEARAQDPRVARTALLDELDELDRVANQIAVPLAHADELYALRDNIDTVRQRVLVQRSEGA